MNAMISETMKARKQVFPHTSRPILWRTQFSY